MMEQIFGALAWMFGDKGVPELSTTLQMAARALVIFASALVIVRLGHKRFFAKFTAFDIIVAFILGSTFSRAINGNGKLFETILTCFLIVGLHRFLSYAACRWHSLGNLIKGHPQKIIEDGRAVHSTLKNASLTESDLMEALRIHAKTDRIEDVKLAQLERNGDISVIMKEKESEAEQVCRTLCGDEVIRKAA